MHDAKGYLSCTSNLIPGIGAGDYVVKAEQTVAVGGSRRLPVATQKVHVAGARFFLAAPEVHQVYPRPESAGAYEDLLPHVALERRVLPWERYLDWGLGEEANKAVPWLALLVFTAAELPGGDAHGGHGGTVERQLLTSQTGVRRPDYAMPVSAAEKQQEIRTIIVPKDLFKAVMPARKELPYLAHVRSPLPGEVKSPRSSSGPPTGSPQGSPAGACAGQVSALEVLEEQDRRRAAEYGFVMAGRLPADEGRYHVHLVSLEGHEKHLHTFTEAHIRLVSLHAWSFTTHPAGAGSFTDLRAALTAPGKAGGTGREALLLRRTPPTGSGTYLQHVQHRLKTGYTAVHHHISGAESTFGWYRGPLTPYPVSYDGPAANWTDPVHYRTTDDGFQVDDLGRPAAWTLGRALALASAEFTASLAGHLEAHQTWLNRAAASWAGGGGTEHDWNPDAALRDTAPTVPHSPHTAALGRLLGSGFTDALLAAAGGPAPSHREAGPTPAPGARTRGQDDPPDEETGEQAGDQGRSQAVVEESVRAGTLNPGGALPALRARMAALLAACDDVAPTVPPGPGGAGPADSARGPAAGGVVPPAIAAWLDRLRLLESVPFDHLVPDPAMLPPESLRFFHVDATWLGALTDGALTITACSHAGITAGRLLRTAYYDRCRELDKEPATAVTPVSGILVRSALVSGYPNVAVTAFAGKGTGPLPVLRRARLAPEVLLCLLAGRAQQVVLTEPLHGLHLGVTHDDKVKLRSLKDATLAEDISATVEVPYRSWPDNYAPVIDIGDDSGGLVKQVQDVLAAKGHADGTTLAPAGLALQMIRSPQKAILETP